ncbi:MAG: segregation/condensation protein A [Planctomycetota bacterium]|jgi:segregation and condensation protein A|nr:segregation/condensation protein A [Planctomycetota bacterium]
MSLNVRIPDAFSGPLDLLLHLIRRDEMDIYDIPVARLTAGYLEELSRLAMVDVDEAAEFLDLASRLAEIKSRMLLPEEDREDPEEESEDLDPRAGLVKALLEYKRFKEAAELLRGLADEQARRYPRIAPRPAADLAEEPGAELDGSDLFAAFQALLYRLAPPGGAGQVEYEAKGSIAVRVAQIEGVLAAAGKTRFSLLLSGKPTRGEMAGFFIAMLELIRQGKLVARQADPYGDIILEARSPAPEGLSRDGARGSAPRGGPAARTRRAPGASRPFPAAAAFRPPPAVVRSASISRAARPFPAGGVYGFGARTGKAPRAVAAPAFFTPRFSR